MDSELEMLCSGAFDGDNMYVLRLYCDIKLRLKIWFNFRIPVSQNFKTSEPLPFSPLPVTQLEDDEPDIEVRRPKVRHLIDDDDNESGSNKQTSSGSDNVEENEDEDEDEQEEEDMLENQEDNEELIDYKKQLFEMEAEESGF